jgi:DNA modification methylase
MARDGKQNGLWGPPDIAPSFSADAEVVIMVGDSAEKLREVPNSTAKLIITSPPYNLGKVYETPTDLGRYLARSP